MRTTLQTHNFVRYPQNSGIARSIFITGSVMDTARAERLGLVSIQVHKSELNTATEKEVDCALKAAPGGNGPSEKA